LTRLRAGGPGEAACSRRTACVASRVGVDRSVPSIALHEVAMSSPSVATRSTAQARAGVATATTRQEKRDERADRGGGMALGRYAGYGSWRVGLMMTGLGAALVATAAHAGGESGSSAPPPADSAWAFALTAYPAVVRDSNEHTDSDVYAWSEQVFVGMIGAVS